VYHKFPVLAKEGRDRFASLAMTGKRSLVMTVMNRFSFRRGLEYNQKGNDMRMEMGSWILPGTAIPASS
jgi:hypothetical protein